MALYTPRWKIIQIFLLILVFLASAFVGFVVHSLERGSGIIGGGKVYYASYYGTAYSWEPGYDALRGRLNGSFPETECGSLRIDTAVEKMTRGTVNSPYVFSEHCGQLMSLADFVRRYRDKVTVGELLLRDKELPNEETQRVVFEELKNQGLLDDVRYKEVTIYQRDNIRDLIYRAFLIPIAIAIGAWLLLYCLGRVVWYGISKVHRAI